MAVADDGQEQRLFLIFVRKLRRKLSVVIIEAPIAFLPSVCSLAAKLFAKVLAYERMRIEMYGFMRIFLS